MKDPYSTFLDPETISTILKWAVTILVAGFIAQFGKKFANFLTEKIRGLRKNKPEAASLKGIVPAPLANTDAALEMARMKLDKKKAKGVAKKEKKTR